MQYLPNIHRIKPHYINIGEKRGLSITKRFVGAGKTVRSHLSSSVWRHTEILVSRTGYPRTACLVATET